MAAKLYQDGADWDEVESYFLKRQRSRAKERVDLLDSHQWPQESEPIDYESEMSLISRLAARRTYLQLGDPTNDKPTPASLRFQEQFMNSEDFQRHLRHLLAMGTTSQLSADAVTGKEMENIYRAATLRTIGLSEDDSTQTIGRWVSPEGTDYQIEVMREFSGSAMIDLIMLAREAGAKQGEVYSMQWKSYQTSDTIANHPTPGRSPNSKAVRIDRLTDIPGSILKKGTDQEVVMAVIKTAQLRLLATNTFVDTSSFKQNASISKDGQSHAGSADWITYTTRLSRPEIHQAITQADPIELLEGAYTTKSGKVVIPVDAIIEGRLCQFEVQTGLVGNKLKRGPRKGQIKLSSRQDPKISIHIPIKGWRQVHAVATPSKIRAGSWMQVGREHGAQTIEQFDQLTPHFKTDFRDQS